MTDIQMGFEHQSDGLGRQFDSIHHEWNKFYITPIFSFFSNQLIIKTKIWYPDLTPKYNPDISKYMGFSEIVFSTNFLKTYWQPKTEITLYKGTGHSLSDVSFCIENSIKIPDKLVSFQTPAALYMQWYKGYGESLKSYKRKTNNFRFGINFLF